MRVSGILQANIKCSKLHGLFLSIKYLLLEDTQRWRGKNTGNPIQSLVTGLGNSGIPLMRFWDFLKNTYGIHFPGMCCELLSDPSILFCQALFHLPAYLFTLSQNSPEQTLLYLHSYRLLHLPPDFSARDFTPPSLMTRLFPPSSQMLPIFQGTIKALLFYEAFPFCFHWFFSLLPKRLSLVLLIKYRIYPTLYYWVLFKKKIIFYWRILASQNFAVFCQTSTWTSHRYTYIPSLLKLSPISLPIPPLSVDTEPLFEFPESYSKVLLAIYFTYDNVSFHVTLSIPLTLSSPLPMSISLFSMSVSPLLPCE